MNRRRNISWQLLVPYVFTLLTINTLFHSVFSAQYVPQGQSSFWPYFLQIAGFALVILTITSIAVFSAHYQKHSKDELNLAEVKKRELPQTYKTYYGLGRRNLEHYNIYSFNHILDKEKDFPGSDIWIVTSDLEEDTNNQELFEEIGKNLKKKVRYTYFLSKVNGKISSSANTGRSKLEEAYKDYLGHYLRFFEIECELLVPEIDLIIYNACTSSREGYVCVEINEKPGIPNEESYFYLRLDTDTLNDIYNVLCGYTKASVNRIEKESRLQKAIRKVRTSNFFVKYKERIYFGASSVISLTGIISIVSFNKFTVIWEVILVILISATYMFVSYFLLKSIDGVTVEKDEAATCLLDQNDLIWPLLSLEKVEKEVEANTLTKTNEVMGEMKLVEEASLFTDANDVSEVWILSDLSWEVTGDACEQWLNQIVVKNKGCKINLLFPDNIETQGRLDMLMDRFDAFGKQIRHVQVSDATHFLLTKSYGFIYLRGKKQNHRAYIQVGNSEKKLYRRITRNTMSERNFSKILGNLISLAN